MRFATALAFLLLVDFSRRIFYGDDARTSRPTVTTMSDGTPIPPWLLSDGTPIPPR